MPNIATNAIVMFVTILRRNALNGAHIAMVSDFTFYFRWFCSTVLIMNYSLFFFMPTTDTQLLEASLNGMPLEQQKNVPR